MHLCCVDSIVAINNGLMIVQLDYMKANGIAAFIAGIVFLSIQFD